MSKEEILYNNISKRGGFIGVSFEQLMDSIKKGSIDMVKGLEASFAAMEEYANQKEIKYTYSREQIKSAIQYGIRIKDYDTDVEDSDVEMFLQTLSNN